MAEIALPRGAATLDRRLAALQAWAVAHPLELVFAGIVIAGALLRFWDLGSRAFHHDESLHATFSWYLYEGRGYRHDPLMHGPFQFSVGALSFFLFGASDVTARLPHAAFGTLLVAMPLFLRRQIGMRAVIIASALIAFSPTLLYFSRFDREDILTVVWTFAVVICVWRYMDEQRPAWLFGMAAALAMAFATKETTFITVAVLVLFIDIILAFELGKRRAGEQIDNFSVAARVVVLAPVAWLVAAFWPLLGRSPFGRERLPPVGDVLVVMGTLAIPQFSAGIQVLTGDHGYNVAEEADLRFWTVFALLVATAYVGLLWKPRVWLTAALFFYVPYVLLFTTFLTNQPGPWEGAFWDGKGGFFTGIWGSLDYWLGQHDVKRGNQPLYYYGLLTPLYEFLPLLLAVGGSFWMARRGDFLKRGLLFWLGGTFVGLSLAGEKMPWLGVHLALPLALAAAISLGAAVERLDFSGRWQTTAVLAAAAAGAAILAIEVGSDLAQYAGILALGGLVGWLLVRLQSLGFREAARGALTVAVAVLFALTLRTGLTAAFKYGDIPVELLVYTQTSPDIPNLRDRIDAVAKESGLGKNLPIAVDGTDGFAWPWAWYLRDYKAVSHMPAPRPGYVPPPDSVVLVARSSRPNVDTTGFSETPYKHRWWFPESYRGLKVGDFLDILTSPKRLESLAHFFLYRIDEPVGSSIDAIALFPASFEAFDPAARQPVSVVAPVTLADGRIAIGRAGSQPGEFQQPADIFVDRLGNIWVADSRNGRIQKFDSAGNFQAILGRFGTARGQFNEPWSVAVDKDGFVYVADTWNHRIQKFSPSLEFVMMWGEPAVRRENPGPLELFGPRDIAIAPDGSVWVTDTGNKRLLSFSSDGKALRQFGSGGSGPGQFEEGVGIAFDAAGNLYVADAWNGRIQKFGPNFASRSEFRVGWASREVVHKPYLAVLSDGRIVASEPAKGLLLLFDREGLPAGQWKPEGNPLPLGVAATQDGGFVFSDGRAGQVQIVPGALVARLFK